jgi:glycosyltransferase involved in cell wall biosynthesis
VTRILFVGQTGKLGGAEFVLLDIARHYRDRCHVALLADGPLVGLLQQAGVPVSVVAASQRMLTVGRDAPAAAALAAIPATIAAARRLARLARGFDLIYANSQKAAIIAMLTGRMLGKPVTWHLHDILGGEHFGGLQRRAAVALANRAARTVLVNSAASRDGFLAMGGRSDLVSIVLNGIDPEPFLQVSDAQAETLRAALCPPGQRLVGLFGRLAAWKGQHVLLEALPQLPDVHAMIVGDAMFGEDLYRNTLHQRAAALGVQDRVSWLGFRQDVAELMRAAEVIVHTSTAPEPFGRVIVEAMLARRPVIAASGGASAEILGADYPHLAAPGDPDALASALRRVLDLPHSEVAQLISANFDRATTLFTIDQMLASIDRRLAA